MEPMTEWLLAAAALALGYALGCVNSGYYLVRSRTGLDLRGEGSGTLGARNTGRVLGRGGFAVALAGDMLKGAAAVLLARSLGGSAGEGAALIGVVLGHMYPAQLRFRGGKGLATAAAGVAVLQPIVAAAAAAATAVALVSTRSTTTAAVAGAIALPGAALLAGSSRPVAVTLLVLCAVLLFRQRPRSLPATPATAHGGRV